MSENVTHIEDDSSSGTVPIGAQLECAALPKTLTSTSHHFETSSSLQKACTFTSIEFCDVLLNLIKNPNITSSHLFRADIFWDSDKDSSFRPEALFTHDDLSGFVKHMKPELRPWKIHLEGFELTRTIVRQLVPRNPQLDKPLLQTCQFLNSKSEDGEETAIVYLPHVDKEEQMPWYHPPLRAIVFLHTAPSKTFEQPAVENMLSIHISPFTPALNDEFASRMARTLQKLFTTIHKHATSRIVGYTKRVHHDRIISQKASQNTYTRLKTKYAKDLIYSWKEITNVTKGVFEDLGIAAFLIELWKQMYDCSTGMVPHSNGERSHDNESNDSKTSTREPPFPGFVDIGCGNGVLVYILIQEGFHGYGFDARSRKTWAAFPENVSSCLFEQTLIPSVLSQSENPLIRGEIHNGSFPAGTFIVSNHADELTPWTPLLAYLNDSPFISIPCCSHDLSGGRWRFSKKDIGTLNDDDAAAVTFQPLEVKHDHDKVNSKDVADDSAHDLENVEESMSIEVDSGGEGKEPSTAKKSSKQPSAYSGLCGYVFHLSCELGYSPEKEVLRIPSTRNTCIVGRNRKIIDSEKDLTKEERVAALIQQQMQQPIDTVAQTYVERAMGVYNSKGRNH